MPALARHGHEAILSIMECPLVSCHEIRTRKVLEGDNLFPDFDESQEFVVSKATWGAGLELMEHGRYTSQFLKHACFGTADPRHKSNMEPHQYSQLLK